MNPFGINGWEAMVTTAIVCGTVIAGIGIGGRITVQMTMRICEACEVFSNAVSDAIVAVFTGKTK